MFFSSDNGATVIQRRRDGSVNFDQTWDKYENGFGDFHGEIYYVLLHIIINCTCNYVTCVNIAASLYVPL